MAEPTELVARTVPPARDPAPRTLLLATELPALIVAVETWEAVPMPETATRPVELTAEAVVDPTTPAVDAAALLDDTTRSVAAPTGDAAALAPRHRAQPTRDCAIAIATNPRSHRDRTATRAVVIKTPKRKPSLQHSRACDSSPPNRSCIHCDTTVPREIRRGSLPPPLPTC